METGVSQGGAILYDDRVEVTRLTPTDGHYFFGYYEKSPWDPTGRYVLAVKSSFMDRPPEAGDEAVVGMMDLQQGRAFTALATTRAWNWQQGCMLQWLPDGRIIFNDRADSGFICVIIDPRTGQRQEWPAPVYAVSCDGRTALSLNFARLHHLRPGYGYAGVADPFADDAVPSADGVRRLDLQTGQATMILSIEEVVAHGGLLDEADNIHWLNHAQINTDGSRFAFLHRWRPKSAAKWKTRFMSADIDGGNLFCISDHEMTSHYDWLNTAQVGAWARRHETGDAYYLFNDQTKDYQIIGQDVFNGDGHCSFSPDKRYMLTDTYPDKQGYRELMIWEIDRQKLHRIGKFHSPAPSDQSIRCDLHPRWSRDGAHVCFDSIHEGFRGMYVADVAAVTKA